MKKPFTLETALEAVSERFCKGHHYKYQPVTDAMVEHICQVKSLVNLGFIGTQITDASLAYMATLPKLKLLFLEEDKKITGEGFTHFLQHPKLEHLGLDKTAVNDETLKIIVQIPKLKSVSLKGTKVTFDGLMAVASCRKINFYLDGSFSPEEIKTFQQAQRNAGKKKLAVNQDDLAHNTQLLLAFFEEMTQWEAFASQEDSSKSWEERRTEVQERCRAIFAKYCTDKKRSGYRPDAISYSMMEGGTYGSHKIIDSEQVTKNKMYIYTQDKQGTQHRFLWVRKADLWLLDDAQIHFGGNWTKSGL
ncbi:NTF2 fold immunity protein [Capnocytophaga sp.]|uniref:NTF2 fold immunity protein n=1 Tax=Capnocytophaga sp. TaxID=44737 RepID=UPI0026DC54D1|nr:NTF2 fold immunity protein [Capnocytophaga sp.]MDO5105254.1 NTF2 fold immunity protein [Capnocytophaga sp.]